jgi:regulator of replication initiation timing
MYNSNNRQYVFKQSSEKLWNFYCDLNLGLCYSTLTRRNTWSQPVSIQRNIHPSFCAEMDREDRFHILFQDNFGNILYALIDKEKVNIDTVLNSKSPSLYNKHLSLTPVKNLTHFFFVLQHSNSAILAHQIYSDGKASIPKVIDYVTDSNCPYSTVRDKSDNMYVFYQLSDGQYFQVGYKKYIAAKKFWGEFTPVTRYEGDCEFPRTIVDPNNIMHICYQRRSFKQYELVYQQKMPDRNIWTSEFIIHSSAYPFDEASLLFISDTIIVYWVRSDTIFFSSSKDLGKSWSKPLRYNFPAGKQLMCISYKTNNYYENEKIAMADVPGSFVNGIKLAFYQDIVPGGMENLSPSELKNLIVESLKLLKANVEELKESESTIQEEILRLSYEQQNMEKEIEKHSVRLSLAESKIMEESKNLKNEITNLKKLFTKKFKIKKRATENTVNKKQENSKDDT